MMSFTRLRFGDCDRDHVPWRLSFCDHSPCHQSQSSTTPCFDDSTNYGEKHLFSRHKASSACWHLGFPLHVHKFSLFEHLNFLLSRVIPQTAPECLTHPLFSKQLRRDLLRANNAIRMGWACSTWVRGCHDRSSRRPARVQEVSSLSQIRREACK